MTPFVLAPASCDANCIVIFSRLWWSKWSCDIICTNSGITGCQWHHCIPKVKMTEMRCNMMFGHMMPLVPTSHDPNGVYNSTIAILRSGQLNWDATWLFWFCEATDIGIKTSMVLSTAHDNDSRNGTRTSTKRNVICLKYNTKYVIVLHYFDDCVFTSVHLMYESALCAISTLETQLRYCLCLLLV